MLPAADGQVGTALREGWRSVFAGLCEGRGYTGSPARAFRQPS